LYERVLARYASKDCTGDETGLSSPEAIDEQERRSGGGLVPPVEGKTVERKGGPFLPL